MEFMYAYCFLICLLWSLCMLTACKLIFLPVEFMYAYCLLICLPVEFAIPNQVSRAAKAFSSSSSSALSSSDHSLSNRYWSAIWKSMYFVKSSVKLYHDSMSCSSRPHRIHDQIFKGNNFSVGEVTSVKKSPGWLVLLKILVLICMKKNQWMDGWALLVFGC